MRALFRLAKFPLGLLLAFLAFRPTLAQQATEAPTTPPVTPTSNALREVKIARIVVPVLVSTIVVAAIFLRFVWPRAFAARPDRMVKLFGNKFLWPGLVFCAVGFGWFISATSGLEDTGGPSGDVDEQVEDVLPILIGPFLFISFGLIAMVYKTSLIDIDKEDGVFRIRFIYCLCFRSTEDIPLNQVSRVNLRHVSNAPEDGSPLYELCVETVGRNVPLESAASSSACGDSRQKQARKINDFLARPVPRRPELSSSPSANDGALQEKLLSNC